MEPNSCEDCRERTLRNKRGDMFNATAMPLDVESDVDGGAYEGADKLGDCTSSFHPVRTYFSVGLVRCQSCGSIWLLGYYEDFDELDPQAEWGRRTWIWRPLTPEEVAQIAAAAGTGALDLDTFAAEP